MKVKCINNQNVEGNLKLNAVYLVLKDMIGTYEIELKKGLKGIYKKERFERVED